MRLKRPTKAVNDGADVTLLGSAFQARVAVAAARVLVHCVRYIFALHLMRWHVLDCVLDVQLGLELISVHEDWKWVKVAILDKTLVPVLDSWLSSTSRHVEDPLYKEHVVGLIGKKKSQSDFWFRFFFMILMFCKL
jgi:hypothetical protein